MNMQRKTLTIAVAATLSAVAGSAFAAYDQGVHYTQTNTLVVKISGSSATNNQTKTWAEKVLCQGTVNDNTNQKTINRTGDSNLFAVICKPKAAVLALPAGKTNIAILKNSTGGSGNGITQVTITPSNGLQYLDVFQAAPQTGPLGAKDNADLGVSDEEPLILEKAGAVPTGAAPVLSEPLNVVTFGTPVTLGLRNALQTSQIASGKLPGCVAGNESEACMPSLSQSQIASIFSGNLVDWAEIGLAAKPVYIARRVITSGTQTAARMFFLNDPCADNMLGFVAGDPINVSPTKADACNEVSPNLVFEGSGGGNVSACLTNHERNSRWAIGINSLELPNLTDSTPAFAINGGAAIPNTTVLNNTTQRHIKIDGFAPTTFNVATGRYKFWYEASLNFDPALADTGLLAVKDAIKKNFNDPAVLVPLNASFNTTVLLGAGKSTGILAPTSAAVESGVDPVVPATEALTVATPQMYYTRSISGTPTSCQPAMSRFQTGINP